MLDIPQKATIAADARESEAKLMWSMSQLFFLIHSGLFSLVLSQFPVGTRRYYFMCGLGIVLGILWFFAMVRSHALVQYWIERLVLLEEVSVPDKPDPDIRIFMRKAPRLTGFPIYGVMKGLVIVFIGVWALLILYPFA